MSSTALQPLLRYGRWPRRLLISAIFLSGHATPAVAGDPPSELAWDKAKSEGRSQALSAFLTDLRRLPLAERPERVSAAGVNQIPVLLVDFDQQAGQKTDEKFEDLLFTGTASMADYFSEVSYGQFTVAGQAHPDDGWYRAQEPLSYYVNGYGSLLDAYPANAQGLVEEVVLSADADVDFSAFDNSGDGFVDAVIVVYAGYSASADGDYQNKIWPHQWRLTGGEQGPGAVTVDGVQVEKYMLVSELFGSSGTTLNKIGTFCHDYGHTLGLPDLYSTDFGGTYDRHWGLGPFALMAYGGKGGDGFSHHLPTHPCAWSKIQLGWVTPVDVSGSLTSERIDEAEFNQDVYRLWTSGQPTTEYFLVEYRHRVGFDQRLPGCGLLIYHVDESVKTDDVDADGVINEFDNAFQWDETHKFIDLEAASQSGQDHTVDADVLDDRNACPTCPTDAGGGGVFFTADTTRDSFSGSSSPSSISYTGAGTSIEVGNVSSCAGDPSFMTADLAVGSFPVPDVNLWVNDCTVDTGSEVSTPPCGTWWTRTDIFIDNDFDGVQDAPVYDEANRLFARVHNLGSTPALGVTVDFYLANSSTGLVFPGTAASLGSSTVALIAVGQRAITSVWAQIPTPPTFGHYCFGVVVANQHDAPASDVLNEENNVGAVNIGHLFSRAGDGTPEGIGGGGLDPGGPVVADFDAENPTDEELIIRLSAEAQLPEGWVLEFEDIETGLLWPGTLGPELTPPPAAARTTPNPNETVAAPPGISWRRGHRTRSAT